MTDILGSKALKDLWGLPEASVYQECREMKVYQAKKATRATAEIQGTQGNPVLRVCQAFPDPKENLVLEEPPGKASPD